MATTAQLDLSIWRNDAVYEFALRVIGPNLTGIGMRAQIRLERDTPGPPLVALEVVDNGNAEGIRLASATFEAGRWVNDVRIRINRLTRQSLPYAGELGDSATLQWAMQIAGRTRLVGAVNVLAHAIDSDAAPLARASAYGSAGRGRGLPQGGATLTIAGEDVASLVIDGGDLAAAVAAAAQQAATQAAAASSAAAAAATAAQALANYRASRDQGVADFAVGAYFSSAETGALRLYRRIASAPGYQDGGDIVAPVTRDQAAFSSDYDVLRQTASFTVAPGAAGALNGAYTYAVTYLTARGETDAGPRVGPITVAGQRIEIDGLPISSDPRVIGRRIYRTVGNPDDVVRLRLVATINDNSTATFTDNVSDAALGAGIPWRNTTGGLIRLGNELVGNIAGNSVSLGQQTGSGYASTFVGYSAGRSVTTGFRLTGFGVDALTAVTTGYEMAAFGIHALGGVTSGRWNNAFGYGALQSLTTAENCNAFGHRALVSVTTGSRNDAFGSAAGILVSTGTDNVLMGCEAGWAITGGVGNVCSGVNAGHAIGNGNFNCFIGFYTGSKATGSSNAAIGANTFTGLTTGSSNTAVGSNSGVALTTGAGNTFIGNGCGSDPNQKADAFLSTAIGYGAFNTRDKEIAIGTTDTDWVVIAGVVFTRTQVQQLRAMLGG